MPSGDPDMIAEWKPWSKIGVGQPLYQTEHLLISVLMTVAIMIAATVSATSQSPAASRAAMDKIMSAVYKPELPGSAVIVLKDGKIIFRKGYGLANMELRTPVRPEMVFRLASVTKQFTAAAIMLLAEHGNLSLDDDVKKFFPNYSTGSKKITIENLLTHTSGIKDYMNDIWPARMREDLSPEDLIQIIRRNPLEFAPGSRSSYSNANYVLLGAIIEKCSGRKYRDFVEENIFVKLGMKHSAYERTQNIIPNRATGYVFDGKQYLNAAYLSMSQLYSAGGLISTVDDLALWDEALYSNTLLTQASRDRIFSRYKLTSGDDSDYGYGWVVSQFLGRTIENHEGGMPGFRASVLRMPQDHVYVAILSNNESTDVQPEYLARRLAAVAIGKPILDPMIIKLDAKTLDQYVGEYAEKGGDSFTIHREGEKLIGQATGDPPVELFPVGNNVFIIKAFDARITFTKNGPGTITGLVFRAGDQEERFEKVK